MIGRVRLRVADPERVRSYYERTIGLRGRRPRARAPTARR